MTHGTLVPGQQRRVSPAARAPIGPLGMAGVVAALVLLALSGCGLHAGYASSPYTDGGDVQRDVAASEQLARHAAELIESDPAGAEKALREALALDLYNGPAHNNLGTLLLSRGELYEAANEFEWAKKLLPGHPDPRVNLAITLEHAGRSDDALASYDAALEVYPHHLGATQGLVRLQLRAGRTDDRTLAMLQEVAMRGESPEWREWAARQAALRGH